LRDASPTVLAHARQRGNGIVGWGGGSSVAWYRIDPRYLRQPDPDGLTLAYVSHGERDTGQLLLHLDRQRAVVRFELSYERFLSRCELYATWDRTAGLKLGEVDTHGRAPPSGPHYPMSPIVRDRRASTADLGSLLGYVTRNAAILDPGHSRVVVAALRAALRRADALNG
jgi:hypothetical protein